MKEYKVLSRTDSFWQDKVDAKALERGLNELAEEGWEVKAIASGEHLGIGGLTGARGELVVILEREYVKSNTAADADTRYYRHFGNIAGPLQKAGLVSKEEMDRARAAMVAAGGEGHIGDYLLSLGVITDDVFRKFLREHMRAKV